MTFSCYDPGLLGDGSWFGITLCQVGGHTKVYLKRENQSSDMEGEQLVPSPSFRGLGEQELIFN